MPRRALRRFSLFVLVAILSSLVPARVQGAPMGPPRDQLVRMPTISDDGEVPIPRPADAKPASLPTAAAVAAAAAAVEAGHRSPGFFDGDFNDILFDARPDVTFGSYTVAGRDDTSSLPAATLTVDGPYHDSVEIDLTVVGSNRPARALIFAGPQGSSSLGYAYLPWVAAGTTERRTLTLALPTTVAYTQPMEIRLDCVNMYTGTSGIGSCIYHKVDFHRTSTRWHRVNGTTHPMLSNQSAVVESFGALGPDIAMNGGPFLGIGFVDAIGSDATNIIRSEALRFPTLHSTDVLTLSFRYNQEVFPSPSTGAEPVYIQIAHLENPALNRFDVVSTDTNVTPGVRGWQTVVSSDINEKSGRTLSGQTRYVMIANFMSGTNRHRTAIDAIQFYLNGKPLALPLDQICTCDDVTASKGKPINTLRGNEVLSATDLSIASGGLPLQFDRLYTSSLTSTSAYTQTALGSGWRHSAAASLTFPGQVGGESGLVIYEAANGQRYRFVDAGSGAYQAQPGVHATLALSGTTYVLTSPGQATQEFSAQGRLTAQVDAQGHRQTISYGDSGAAAGQPVRVTDLTTSRSLTLTYTTLGLNTMPVK